MVAPKELSAYCCKQLLYYFAVLSLEFNFTHGILTTEANTAFFINISNLNPNHIADIDYVLDLINAMVGQLGNKNQAFFAGSQFYKSANREYTSNLAIIQSTYL